MNHYETNYIGTQHHTDTPSCTFSGLCRNERTLGGDSLYG